MIFNKFKLLKDVLRSSFISLIPYYVFYSMLLLLITALRYFGIDFFVKIEDITNVTILLGNLFPVLINLSISYHLSIIYKTNINKIILMVLNLLIFLSVEFLLNSSQINKLEFSKYTFLALLIPLISYYLINLYMNLFKKYNLSMQISLSKNISNSFMYIIPFFLTFIILVPVIYLTVSNVNFDFGLKSISHEMTELLLFIRMIFSHIFWFIGIHGANFFDTIISFKFVNDALIPNLTAKEFYDLFVILGGSGAGVSLVLAIFMASRDKHIKFIGKLSLPFVIFNINEILIFGIPIILNFTLIIPFILVPVINFIVAYIFVVVLALFEFNSVNLPWTTPALINIYLTTDGNIFAVLFQMFLIVLGALIYVPFMRKYSQAQSSTFALDKMSEKLDISLEIETKTDIKFREAQSSLIKSHFKVDEVLNLINQNNLFLYYQAKIDISNNTANCYESLIRIKDESGNIKGPYFIEDIEDSGLASIVDLWVCKEVKKDLEKWARNDFYPNIAINIFPYTLEDIDYVEKIIELLEDYNITIEIIERRSSLSDTIIENLNYLKSKGFSISLDDTGSGFTNFEVLYKLLLDSVKIDKSIVDMTETTKGYLLYKNICKLSKDLNYKIILEGIETVEQFEKLKDEGVDFVQGWLYSKALPYEEVIPFKNYFELKAGRK